MTTDEKIKMLETIKITHPSKEECDDFRKQFTERCKPNCITIWFPALLELGVNVPRTEIVELPVDLIYWAYGEPDIRLDECIESITVACDKIGYPCFLRSGQTSGKHDWKKSCFVPSREVIRDHVYRIVEYGAMADDLPSTMFAARELIPTSPIFTAFYGEMPVTREFRFFVNEGCVVHIQPYWPEHAIEENYEGDEDWRPLLRAMNHITTSE